MRTVELPLPSANAALLPRPLFTIMRPARSAQTAQTRPASLNDQVTAMRGRQSSLAPRMRRQHWRPFAPPPRPSVAAPARHRRAGSWGRRAASLRPTPARPRAPLAAVGGKARANNRGLAKVLPDMGPKPGRPKDPFMCKPCKLNSNRSILVIGGIGPRVSTSGP